MKEPYDNFVEWDAVPSFQELMERARAKNSQTIASITGVEVTEATQEEYDAAVHRLRLYLERTAGD